ncbi:MAG: hypothetical protein L7S70_07290 [Pseudomonadales bacterium]|jgi:hypothetical protein|nr:hypothetical protein [Pseudomonadales bacterium]
MSKRSKKQSAQGTYALCITIGLMTGLGFGPYVGNVLLSILGGGLLGYGAGYWFTHLKSKKSR